ncbi:MAG: o-succinylbenzoate synthase [Bifidobacteriaceae bacterium]|nr:o-succinylbenzoate synthase [Bifidobacteriaceae bacterium]
MATVFDIPMTHRFRGTERRRGVVFQGDAGWAEFSPFGDYPADEAVAWWRAAEEAAEEGFPAPHRAAIPVNATVPAVPASTVEELAASWCGATTVKVKVAEPGQSSADEADRVAAVRAVLGPTGRIRIDANGAWDVDTAVDRIVLLARAAAGLEYVEQPCATAAELAQVRRQAVVPIAADESIRRALDPLEVKRLEAADLVVLKVQPLGGVRACLRLAEELDLPVVVSSAVETSIGLAMGLALAAALPRLDYACGLGTRSLLGGDLVRHGLWPSGGMLELRRVAPDAALLRQWQASPEVSQAWQRRLDQVRRLAARPGVGL